MRRLAIAVGALGRELAEGATLVMRQQYNAAL